ncbi:MAG: SDR family NAD(P)-dependent oxidoreductase [Myxococcota bacterium]
MPRLSQLDRSIAGRVALVTGAASGMGRATAHLFADEGAAVAVLDRDAGGVEQVAKEIIEAGGSALALAVDVGDAQRVAALPDEVASALGPLDILVNNAGISVGAAAGSADYAEHWERAVRVNLTAHTLFLNAFLDQLARRGEGRVVNVASTEGLGATAGLSPYTATKHGVVGLTRAWAVELGPRGVTVNCICPGPIHTGMTSPIPDAMKQKFARRRVPLRRYGDPEEVAQITLGLVLPAASYITGAIVPVDGGLMAQNT